MKTCPICNAKTFDDMDVCYGCLHRFGKERFSPSSGSGESGSNGKVDLEVKQAPGASQDGGFITQGAECDLRDKNREETGSNSERLFVVNVPLSQEVKGVRVAVDFDIPSDPHARMGKGENLAD